MATPAAPIPQDTIVAKTGDEVTLSYAPGGPNAIFTNAYLPADNGTFSLVAVDSNIAKFKMPQGNDRIQIYVVVPPTPPESGKFTYTTTSNSTPETAVNTGDIFSFSGTIHIIGN